MNGRSPGFSAEIGRYPDDDVFVAVLANTYVPTASIIAKDIARMVFGAKYELPKINKPIHMDAAALEPLTGHYKFGADFFVPNGLYSVERKSDELWIRYPGSDTLLVPQSETEFFVRPFWSSVIFVKDKAGKVNSLLWRYGGQDYRAERVP
jgi:hypothetical protein